MFDQYQSMMGTWEVLQRLEVSSQALATSTHCLGLRVWLGQLTSHLLTSSCNLPSQSIPLACDSVSKLQSPGEQRSQEVTPKVLGAARQR